MVVSNPAGSRLTVQPSPGEKLAKPLDGPEKAVSSGTTHVETCNPVVYPFENHDFERRAHTSLSYPQLVRIRQSGHDRFA